MHPASSPRLYDYIYAHAADSRSRDSQQACSQRADRDMASLISHRSTVRSKSTQQPVSARPWSARRPPRCAPVRRSVARWEKEFCEANGVPWKKVTDPCAGLNAEGPGGRVACWDDSGAVQALLAAKKRYWAEINGGVIGHAVPPLPDPDMYIDVVVDDEDGGGEEEEEKGRYADAVEKEYAAAVRDMERAGEEGRRMRAAARRDDFVPVPTGWDL
ncbi:hypothetical protein EJB05_35267, partial [Eragrostis curvula]